MIYEGGLILLSTKKGDGQFSYDDSAFYKITNINLVVELKPIKLAAKALRPRDATIINAKNNRVTLG